MNKTVVTNIIRFFLLVIVQVLVFKRIAFNWGDFVFIHFIIYPLFIIMLPVKIPRPLVIALGFLIGIFVDIFYDSPGIHASAGVFIGYARGVVLDILEPHEGYARDSTPSIAGMGLGWFIPFVSILLGLHLLWYFSMEAFSFVYIIEILLNSIVSFIASFSIIMLLLFIFKSKK